MSQTYVFIKGYLDTLDVFSDEMMAYLTASGHRVLTLHKDSMNQDIQTLLTMKLKKEPIHGAIVFNNLGYSLGEDQGINLWEALEIPYINILMDHPFHFPNPLSLMPKTARIFCIDRNHVDFLKRYYPNLSKVDFLPHGGCAHAIQRLEEEKIKTPQDIDILYAGNLARDLTMSLIPDFDHMKHLDGAAFSQELLEDLISNPRQTTENVICRHLKDKGLSLSPKEELSYIHAFRFVDGFAVSFFRELSVRVLCDYGLQVHVLGDGWESSDFFSHPNLTLLGRVDAHEVFSYMKRAKVVLNTLTWFKDGAHDRIFNGMLAKAAVVTDDSLYLRETFGDKQELCYFDLQGLSHLPEIIQSLLSDETKRSHIAKAGYEVARHHHTWENRLDWLLTCGLQEG